MRSHITIQKPYCYVTVYAVRLMVRLMEKVFFQSVRIARIICLGFRYGDIIDIHNLAWNKVCILFLIVTYIRCCLFTGFE